LTKMTPAHSNAHWITSRSLGPPASGPLPGDLKHEEYVAAKILNEIATGRDEGGKDVARDLPDRTRTTKEVSLIRLLQLATPAVFAAQTQQAGQRPLTCRCAGTGGPPVRDAQALGQVRHQPSAALRRKIRQPRRVKQLDPQTTRPFPSSRAVSSSLSGANRIEPAKL
jgi:hypothetical protein